VPQEKVKKWFIVDLRYGKHMYCEDNQELVWNISDKLRNNGDEKQVTRLIQFVEDAVPGQVFEHFWLTIIRLLEKE
jgi:hypothetical protein